MSLRIVFAGDRDIAVKVLKFIIDEGVRPLALLIPDEKKATHAQELITLCSHLDKEKILEGEKFKTKAGKNLLKNLNLDYIISIHFPYIYPKEIIEIPKHGIINLHPAYLPYNRGWHTPTWAIWEETPFGASLHFVNEKIDAGDIIHQKLLEIFPHDTADTLYKRVKDLELETFKEAWPLLVSFTYTRKPQPVTEGTFHKKEDIKKLQFIDLEQQVKAGDLVRRIRALTTNNIKEAAFFILNGKKYRVQIRIIPEDENIGQTKA